MRSQFIFGVLALTAVLAAVMICTDGRTGAKAGEVKSPVPLAAQARSHTAVSPKRPSRPAAAQAAAHTERAALPTNATAARLAGMVHALTDDPNAKALLAMQLSEQIELTHGLFLSQLGLDESGRAAVRDLLLERRFMEVQCALRRLDFEVPATEREAALKQWKQDLADWQERLGQALGPDGMAAYTQYEESQPARVQVSLLQQELATRDRLLTAEQAESVQGIVQESLRQYPLLKDVEDPLAADPGAIGAPTVAQYERDLEACRQSILSRVRGVLANDQLSVFDDLLTADIGNRQANLKMGLGLLVGQVDEQ